MPAEQGQQQPEEARGNGGPPDIAQPILDGDPGAPEEEPEWRRSLQQQLEMMIDLED